MIRETICTAVIPSTPAPGGGLASTGTTLVPLLVVGVMVVMAGVVTVLARRHRSLLLVAGVALAGLLVAGGASARPSYAAEPAASGCALIRVDEIDRGDASNLLPGQAPVRVLEYTVTNVTDFPIDIAVGTVVTSDPSSAAGLVTTIISDPAGSTITPLGSAPATATLRLHPGQASRYQYQVAVPAETGNSAQDAVMTFDSIITAAQH